MASQAIAESELTLADFDFELPPGGAAALPETPLPGAADLDLLRGRVAEEASETYPRFGALIAAV